MNTHGHHEVSKTAGQDALTEALQAYPQTGQPRTAAFYLGNWLTDVSQAYDPVSFASVASKADKLRKELDSIIDKLFGYMRLRAVVCTPVEWVGLNDYFETCNEYSLESEKATLNEAAAAVKSVLLTALHMVFVDPAGRKTYRNAGRSAVKVKAYFKFAHPALRQEGTTLKEHPKAPMDFQSFLEVFDGHFTQYFPHEHLDRWPVEQQAWAVDGAYRSRKSTDGVSMASDMYTYLRDDIQIVAGKLAELDLEWARKTFDASCALPIDDRDPEWNHRLSELGHVLHAVEDFFAHSNWIEHAVKAIDDPANPKFLPTDTLSKTFVCALKDVSDDAASLCDGMDRYGNGETLHRRLRKLISKTVDGATEPDLERSEREQVEEPHVVTGTFDFQDTWISICHMLEELFLGLAEERTGVNEIEGLEAKEGNLHRFVDTIDQKDEAAKELLRDALEFVHDPQKLVENPRVMSADGTGVDHENVFGKKLKELAEEDEAAFRKAMAPLSGDLMPAAVVDRVVESEWFWDAVASFLQAHLSDLPKTIAGTLTRGSQQLQEFIPDQIREALEAALRDFSTVTIKPEDIKSWVERVTSGSEMTVVRVVEAIQAVSGWRHIYERGMTLYEAVKTVAEIIGGPVAWLKKALKDWLPKAVAAEVAEIIIHHGEGYVMDFFGARRIGCHSLLAKDHGNEWLYPYQKSCAKAVHYYVLRTLFRWARAGEAPVCRADPGASGEDGLSVLEQNDYIDWMDLLEYFLCNPVSGLELVGELTSVRRVQHQVQPGETLASLAQAYRSTSDGESLTWEDIAIANFGDGVCQSRDDSQAIPGVDMNILAFMLGSSADTALESVSEEPLKPGTQLEIPKQVWSLPVYMPLDPRSSWFGSVCHKEYELGTGKGYEAFRDGIVNKGRTFHLPMWVLREDVQELASEGARLRVAAEQRYNAKSVLACDFGSSTTMCSEASENLTLDQVDRGPFHEGDYYNWYEALLQAGGHPIDTKDLEMNIIGIRAFADGQLVENASDVYNDTIAVIWREGEVKRCKEYKGSVDPGFDYTDKPLNSEGCAHLVDGQYLYKLGKHHGHDALVQAQLVRVWRDRDKDFACDPDELVDEGWFGVNIHAGGVKSNVGAHSAGCQVIAGGWDGDAWRDFYKTVAAHAGSVLRYTLVDGLDLQHVISPIGKAKSVCAASRAPVVSSVVDVQRALNRLEFTGRDGNPLDEDGIVGNHTRHAVTCFQQLYGLETDGIAGPVTRGRLGGELARAGLSPA